MGIYPPLVETSVFELLFTTFRIFTILELNRLGSRLYIDHEARGEPPLPNQKVTGISRSHPPFHWNRNAAMGRLQLK